MELPLLLLGVGLVGVSVLVFVFRVRLAESMNRSLEAMYGGFDNVTPQWLAVGALFLAVFGVIFVVTAA